ncbi:cytochrome ubiquinol oxidase subunit I, partial [Proteus mirabilis]|uniref:cytochrome ubiquinol oxidase subunit I n=1 Tax=Proteus mirabilis TaxID=584 RepID=UPI0022486D1B
EFAPEERPNSTVVFWSFRLMAGLGMLMLLLGVLAMAAVGGLAVGVPAVSMMLTSVMGTLSGGVSVENVTLRHFAALFD